MQQFDIRDLISRARCYVDDDHNDTDGWISQARWLDFFNVELTQLRQRWLRTGVIKPPFTDQAFSGPTVTVNSPAAIIGVARDYGGGVLRVLEQWDFEAGFAPFGSSQGEASRWRAVRDAFDVVITLEPQDTQNYVVRYIAGAQIGGLVPITDPAAVVVLPSGGDERLVLGMARRAKIKEGGSSAQIERLIGEADAEIAWETGARFGQSPRVRRVPRNRAGQFGASSFSLIPATQWYWP